jgi:TatA/E family protein of Tat protein translocase
MGPLGFPELILIFIVALIVFGPKRLPEIGRTIGKALGEFKKATDDLKSTIEREVHAEELKELTTLPKFNPYDSVSRSEPAASQTVTVESTPVPAPNAPSDPTPAG